MKDVGWSVLALACALQVSGAQVEIGPKEEVPPYYVDAISFASSTSKQSRIDVYAQIPFGNLAFVKKDDGYHASYEMTMDLLDSTGRMFNEKLWTEEVRAESFEQSVSSQASSFVQRVFEVPPGAYWIATIVRDNETRQSQRLIRKLTVPDYSTRSFSLSDIMLISKFNAVGEKKTIVPSVSSNVGLIPDAFHIFFEAYNGSAVDSVNFEVDIVNEKNEKIYTATSGQKLSAGRNQVFIKIEHGSLPIGEHALRVRALTAPLPSEGGEKYLAATSRSIVVRWKGLPLGIKDIELAIEQCVYEAKGSEMSYLHEAKTPEEKQKRFLEFWRKRDPNPSTPRNEKMEKYFGRVEYANKNFKHYVEGWRTDMGMVYIIFGPPSNVDRHPFDIDSKPYEVWTYYELNHSFVFIDQSGFGDYRLNEPIGEVWQRPRD